MKNDKLHDCKFHPIHHEDAKNRKGFLRVFVVRFFGLRLRCSLFICVHRWFSFCGVRLRELDQHSTRTGRVNEGHQAVPGARTRHFVDQPHARRF